MSAADVAEVEHALYAEHQILAGHEVAARLGAADEAAVIFATVVRRGRADDVLRYPFRIHPVPAAADIAADVAAIPVVQERCDDGSSLDRHVCSRGDAGCSQTE